MLWLGVDRECNTVRARREGGGKKGDEKVSMIPEVTPVLWLGVYRK
jgi:hypothetical protein